MDKHWRAPADWKLTGSEEVLVRALLTNSKAPTLKLMDAVYASVDPERQPEKGIIRVYICRVRRKLAPRGIQITWSPRGYAIDAKQRRALLEAAC